MRLLLAALAVCPCLPATAQEVPARKAIELYCTDGDGARRELGEVICITAGCQTWLAKCDMSLNNVMWRKLQDGCPGVDAAPAAPVDRLPMDRLRTAYASARPATPRPACG